MNLSRISKKVPHVDHRETLSSLHSNKLKEFADHRATLPDKEKLLSQLIEQYNSDTCNVDRHCLYKTVCDLQLEVKNLRGNEYETKYLLNAAPFLVRYYNEIENNKKKHIDINNKIECGEDEFGEDEFGEDECGEDEFGEDECGEDEFGEDECGEDECGEYEYEGDEYEDEYKINKNKSQDLTNFITKEETSNKGKIYKEYQDFCLSGCYSKDNKTELEKLKCPCGGNRIVIRREAIASCESCGSSISYIDDTGPMEYRPEVEILSPFAYKRINHFREWIAQLQAKETTSPSDDVINILLLELKKERITDIDKITPNRIKCYLKKLRLNKQYEHVSAIINKLCGIPPPIISRKLENKLICMFEEAQIPFEKHRPKGRNNFLSYSYTLHKMCQLLGEDQLLPCFPLLKSREKLYLQDKMWKLITLENKWEYYPSL